MTRALVTVAVAAMVVPTVTLATPTNAAAFTPPPENGLAVVANQNAGCANDQQVVVATPKSNGAFSSTLGKPSSIVGMLNDAKPFDNNRKVVAIWGEESQAGHLGGVGIYDRTATPPTWTTAFPLPSGWTVGADYSGLAHSVTAIEQPNVATPDVVVAQTGGIPNGNTWGNVVLFHPTSATTATQVQALTLQGVHGVEWDTSRNALFAVGDSYIEKYSYDSSRSAPLQKVASWQLKAYNNVRGGHDLRRRRTSNDFFVTTNSAVWTFNPDIADAATAITQFTALGGGVKSMDERFDGLVEWVKGDGQFHYTDGSQPNVASGFCMKEYKVRWMYAPGDAEWNNDDGTPPPTTPPPAGNAERFLWEHHWLTGAQDLANSGEIWAGGAAGDDTPLKCEKRVTDAIAANKIPYIKFYHWGDSGHPTMGNVLSATDAQWKSWSDCAAAMAAKLGQDREATIVIEPEWDSNPEAPCDARYQKALNDVIGKFRSLARKAKIINGVGFWDDGLGTVPNTNPPKSKYHCFQEPSTLPGGAPLRTLFDGHGFLIHRFSNGYAPAGAPYYGAACSLRDPNNSEYKKGNHTFGGGTNLADALKKMDLVPTLLDRVRNIFATDRAYITDVFVTRCGWNDDGQQQIIGKLTSLLQNNANNLYATHGLRGVAFREGGPGAAERFCGVANEGMSDYASNTATLNNLESARAGTQAYLASISGSTPDFSLTVTNPPTVAPGDTARLLLSVQNTGGSVTGANVDIEVYNSAGQRVTPGQATWSAQDFTTTAPRSYAYDWPAAATPGTYTIKAGVFDSAWHSPPIKWKDNASTIVVGTAQPAFTATATATPSTIAPDGSTTIAATVTDTGGALSNGVVTIDLYQPSGAVEQEWQFPGESFTSGQAKPYSVPWTAGSTGGAYRVGVTVTDAGGTPTYFSQNGLATVTVSTSKFTSSVALSRGTVAAGGTSTVTTTITNTGTADLVNGIVDVEFYDPSGGHTQTSWSGVNLAVGAHADFPTTWTAPATAGTYTVKVGVFTTGWADTLHWNGHAATLTVSAITFDLEATAAPSKVMPGGATTITVAVQPTGGSVDGAIVDVEVFDSAGVRVPAPNGQMSWSNQTLNNGTTYTYTWNLAVPSTPGTYTVKTGVFPAGWGPVYKWVDNADQIEVANPSHTMTASVSASSVAPGGQVTITANYTNNGGAMTNGILDMEIYDPVGGHTQTTWTGTSLDNGYTATRTYLWTAPVTPGTYTVRLGVFSSTWAQQWGWNNSAVTISVGSTSFQPSFVVGDGANSWWFEVYTSNDVTSVDVIADNGRIYQTLPKKSWGAFAAQPSSEVPAGQTVQFIARRSSDGASASSTSFAWLTGTPATVAGWAANLARGSGSSGTWVEASAAAAATEVWVKAGQGAWTLLTYSPTSGKWGKAMNVSAGTKVVFKAKRSDGAWGYSTVYGWLQ